MLEVLILFLVFACAVIVGLALGGRLRFRRERKP